MIKIILPFLLTASLTFANDPNANLGDVMAIAATGQMIKMVPLFILAIGIAIFFSLVQKNPQKAALGCGGFFAIAFVLGVISLFLEFIANHAFLFILLALTLIVVCLVIYMIYTPPNPKNK